MQQNLNKSEFSFFGTFRCPELLHDEDKEE